MAKFCYFIEAADRHRRSIPIGKPIAGAKAVILDDSGKVCDAGTVGEIHIRTPFLTLGYFNRPELTRQVFIPNPLSQNSTDIIYKTGDLGRVLADGNFELIGRIDHQVKIRGQRVELGEIEAVLKKHAAVVEAAAIVKESGPDDQRLVIYFVAAEGQPVSLTDLRLYLFDSLPEHMVPSVLMPLEAMPLTRTGKIDRNMLPEPDDSRPQLEQEYVAPRDSIEETLAAIWIAILRLQRVGVHDNFFQLGGHSLLATQVISRVREVFQMDVPLRRLFETPTIAGFKQAIEQHSEQAALDDDHLMAMVEQMSENEVEAMLERLSTEQMVR
jgi:aryl carrier-like protein